MKYKIKILRKIDGVSTILYDVTSINTFVKRDYQTVYGIECVTGVNIDYWEISSEKYGELKLYNSDYDVVMYKGTEYDICDLEV